MAFYMRTHGILDFCKKRNSIHVITLLLIMAILIGLFLLRFQWSRMGQQLVSIYSPPFDERAEGKASLPEFCPPHSVYAKNVADDCEVASDPNNLKKSPIEKWFTEEMFNDLFPKANLGLGPHDCLPYSYKAFIIAARYFPEFGGEGSSKVYKRAQHERRDVAAFFAHVLQETGENDISLFNTSLSDEEKADCFYRGGFYNWFERGPNSSFLLPAFPGFQTVDGKRCTEEGRYCKRGIELDYWSPCNESTETHASQTYHRGCYFGRGALQLSWNYNYGLFQQFLLSRGIKVDLINNPNLVVTKMDPPLAMLASLWFYMTPQPPKPSMHSIVVTGDNQKRTDVQDSAVRFSVQPAL